jgi:hypothetical protein
LAGNAGATPELFEMLIGDAKLIVMQMGQAMMGPFSERHRQWLADVDAARQLPEATPAVRSWLGDFAGRLRLGLQEQLRREADERVNCG